MPPRQHQHSTSGSCWSVMPRKAKRRYLLTFQVSTYRLLALHSGVGAGRPGGNFYEVPGAAGDARLKIVTFQHLYGLLTPPGWQHWLRVVSIPMVRLRCWPGVEITLHKRLPPWQWSRWHRDHTPIPFHTIRCVSFLIKGHRSFQPFPFKATYPCFWLSKIGGVKSDIVTGLIAINLTAETNMGCSEQAATFVLWKNWDIKWCLICWQRSWKCVWAPA